MLSDDVYFTTVAHDLLKLYGNGTVNFLFGHPVHVEKYILNIRKVVNS